MDITDYSAAGQIAVAFIAGLVSFLSPCVLPLVPGYISIVSGSSLDQLKASEKDASLLRTVLLSSVMFIIGFSVTFVLLGASATWIGQVLVSRRELLDKIAGLILIVFGIHVLGIVKINALYQDKRFHNVGKPRGVIGAFVLGLAFAFGWTPCLGPILAGILAIAAAQNTIGQGIRLLAAYSMGLAIPFFAAALAINQFFSAFARIRKHYHVIELASGALLVVIGILIFTNRFTIIARTLQPYLPVY